MDKKQIIKISKKYIIKINEFLPLENAFLFGSYVNGKPRKDSDIDIGLLSESRIKDYYSILQKLYHERQNIDVRIEPHLFIKRYDPAGFYAEVIKNSLNLLKH